MGEALKGQSTINLKVLTETTPPYKGKGSPKSPIFAGETRSLVTPENRVKMSRIVPEYAKMRKNMQKRAILTHITAIMINRTGF